VTRRPINASIKSAIILLITLSVTIQISAELTPNYTPKKKPNRGPRLTPTGLRRQHPQRGGTGGGNAQQHETQAAAQEHTKSVARAQKLTHTNPWAQHRSQQKPQPRKQRRQERSTQHHAESENSPAGRRRNPGARACNTREPHPHQKSPYEAPGARAREQARQEEGGPTDPPRGHWVRATTRGSFVEHSATDARATCNPQPCQAGAQ
jgi:hypothetical protein